MVHWVNWLQRLVLRFRHGTIRWTRCRTSKNRYCLEKRSGRCFKTAVWSIISFLRQTVRWSITHSQEANWFLQTMGYCYHCSSLVYSHCCYICYCDENMLQKVWLWRWRNHWWHLKCSWFKIYAKRSDFVIVIGDYHGKKYFKSWP